jgi:glyoxylase-like metal-dependent hydrolase (beta-lactamase superfamily II)
MERWEESFNRLGIRPSDIRKIVLTHPHVDHFGAAGELQKITRAPVQMPGNNTSTLFLKEWLKEVLADNIFNRFGLPED